MKTLEPRRSPCAFLGGAALSALVWLSGAYAQQDEEQALAAVRAEIEALEKRVARQSGERDEFTAELRRLELDIAEHRQSLTALEARVAAEEATLADLSRESAAARARLGGERAALAQQVRLSYLTGREEILKLLLNQEDAGALGRTVVYYDYLNRARSERIGAVSAELELLARVAAETEAARDELARLEDEQRQGLARLDATRGERRALVEELEGSIEAAGVEVERLQSEEQRLTELLVELGEVLAAFPVGSEQPFAALKGKLAWPVPGELAAEFGQPRGGDSMRWNGVLLESVPGTDVRAVYHGRVVFSDWLPGLGLLIIVDHGEGYMSLYGHNEALLKDSGDPVTPGEAIAQVGDSGGQMRSSLYFEIRRDGEPVDPRQWVLGPPASVDQP